MVKSDPLRAYEPFKIKLDSECKQNPEEKIVVDERCYCGHRQTEHSDGHGACKLSGCLCDRFTWFGWIFSDGSEA